MTFEGVMTGLDRPGLGAGSWSFVRSLCDQAPMYASKAAKGLNCHLQQYSYMKLQ